MVNRAYEETMDRSYSSPIHNYDCDDDESGGKDDKILSYRGERRIILASTIVVQDISNPGAAKWICVGETNIQK
jgi:hypothetical protein